MLEFLTRPGLLTLGNCILLTSASGGSFALDLSGSRRAAQHWGVWEVGNSPSGVHTVALVTN